MVVEQVINSFARIAHRQQLLQIHLVQFLDQLAKTLRDPTKILQKALALRKMA